MTDFPEEIKIETRHGAHGGAVFYVRDVRRGTPVYAGQELATYVLKSSKPNPIIEKLAEQQFERHPILPTIVSWEKLSEDIKHGFRLQAEEDLRLIEEQLFVQ